MGSTIITKQRAAELLGVSVRCIYLYVAKGTLRSVRVGRMVGIPEEDVTTLLRAGDLLTDIAFNKTNFLKLYEDVQYLKSRLHTLERVYDVQFDRLNLEDKELHQLYEAAKNYSQEGWPPHVEQQWADTFVRLHVDDLRQLQTYLKEDHPWKPFYLLCNCMHQAPFNKFLRDQFNAGRHHMQQLVTLWGQVRGESPTIINALVRDEAEPMKRLLNKLHKDKNTAGQSPY